MLAALLTLAVAVAPPLSPVPPRQVTVTGEARVTFVPNQVVVSFSLGSTHRDLASLHKAHEDKVRKFLEACRAAGVEPRQWVLVHGGPTPDYRGSEVIGQVMTTQVTITLSDMARVDPVLDAALRAGGQPSGAVVLRNTEHVGYETKARIAAAATAKERAAGMVEAVGGKLGLPRAISDATQRHDGTSVGGLFVLKPGVGLPASFAGTELSVTSTVTAVFDIQDP
jgi:uncharacterized protein YggE